MQFFAHSGQNDDKIDWQLLKEHLRNVATLAKRFAEEARPGDKAFAETAYVAGLLHDLGKYRPECKKGECKKGSKHNGTKSTDPFITHFGQSSYTN